MGSSLAGEVRPISSNPSSTGVYTHMHVTYVYIYVYVCARVRKCEIMHAHGMHMCHMHACITCAHTRAVFETVQQSTALDTCAAAGLGGVGTASCSFCGTRTNQNTDVRKLEITHCLVPLKLQGTSHTHLSTFNTQKIPLFP